jgi:hypothetical protein
MENKEVLPEQWQESVIVPIYKKGDKVIKVAVVIIFLHN